MTIGLVIMNMWQPGLAWSGHVDELLNLAPGATPFDSPRAGAGSGTPLEEIASYIPRTMLQPFSSSNVIGVVIFALVLGALLRRLRGPEEAPRHSVEPVVRAIERIYRWLVRVLWWIIRLVPFAVFGVVAQVVGRVGLGVFSAVWIFLAAILVGLLIHAFVYYPLVAWLVGKKSPKVYLGKGADADHDRRLVQQQPRHRAGHAALPRAHERVAAIGAPCRLRRHQPQQRRHHAL